MNPRCSTPALSTNEGFMTPPSRVDSPQPDAPLPPMIRTDDIIIAVMGITGCGKTTFVNLFADHQLVVGHTLDSCTQSVEIAACTLADGTTIYLVDTPGFNDTLRSDTQILREVCDWLIKAHNSKFQLAGIIYLHRIVDNRMGGSNARNLKMFRKLCGDKNLGSVVLATTHWDSIDEKTGQTRERDLQNQERYWAPMIREGSQVLRHDQEKASGLKIINHLKGRRTRMTLEIQRELVDQNLRLEQTGAGSELATAVELLLKGYEEKIRILERELQESNADQRERLEDAKQEWQEKIQNLEKDNQDLKANQNQILEEGRLRYAKQLEQEREKHSKDLADQLEAQKKQLKEDFLRRMQQNACAVM